jgi:hypothetical protein
MPPPSVTLEGHSTAQSDEEVDNDAEAQAFVAWVRGTLSLEVDAELIRPVMADRGLEDPKDPFVEDSVRRLLSAIELAPPPDLPA